MKNTTLLDDEPFFHLQLKYKGDSLVSHRLMPHVVLASKSPRRKDLLEQIGIFADVVPSEVTEFTLETEPAAVVEDLSSQKANGTLLNVLKSDKYGSIDELIVIAADTVVVNDGQILGKPSSHDDAFQMIKALQGKTHQVYTGVTLVFLERADGKFAVRKKKIFFEETDVTVSAMTDEEIRDYADSDEPMDKAGSYGIQGTFARFIERINGDYNNVVGLPVSRVYRELREG
jgi:septum formation protein